MPISDCWPDLESSLALLDPPTHKRITSLHDLLLPLSTQIQEYATSLHPFHLPCRLFTSAFTWGQSFLVYELVFYSGDDNEERSWVARFGLPPYEGDEFFNTPKQLERKILNEVGALRVVKQRTAIPVPDIFGFCPRHGADFQRHFGMVHDDQQATSVHPLGEAFPAFILMSAMKGKTIEECGFPVHELGGHWESPTSDPTYDAYLQSPILRRYLSSLADIHVQLSQITFPQIGSFTLHEESGEVRMGPLAEFGLGPFNTAEEYYAIMAEAFKRIAESAVVDDDEDGTNSEVVINIQTGKDEAGQRMSLPSSEIKALRRMFTASLFPLALAPHLSPENNSGPFPLRHGDLHSENILVDEETGEIVGVIDWEGAGTVPWEAAGALNWEMQGEVVEWESSSSLARPEVHGAFNGSLREIEQEMRTRFEARTRRPKKLQFEERRSSACSSEYITPPTGVSPSSSSVSLASTTSSSSFGGTELFSDVDDGSTRQYAHSRSSSSSRSNLTGATSPPTSPASSLFFDVSTKVTESPQPHLVLTPNPNRLSEVHARILSVFNRNTSEPSTSFLSLSTPTRPSHLLQTHTRMPSLSPAAIESIREPLPSPTQVDVQGEPSGSGVSSLSLSVAALAITTGAPPTCSTPMSASPAAHAPVPLSSSPSTPSTPLAPFSSPGVVGPRSRFVHRRKQSSIVLSIPSLMMNTRSGSGAGGFRVSPGGSPSSSGAGSLSLPPFHRWSRTASPSPSAPSSPMVSASHIRPGPGYQARRPSSFYLPGSSWRGLSGAGALAPTPSSSARTWTTAPSSPIIPGGSESSSGGSYFPLTLTASVSGSAASSDTSGTTPTVATEAQVICLSSPIFETHTLAISPINLPPQNIPTSATSSPLIPAFVPPLLAPKIIGKAPSLSMNIHPPVTAPSGVLLSELHGSVGSYVAGYLGHWMYVYACEWETVGRALWAVVEKGKGVKEVEEEAYRADGEEEDDAERAFWNWVREVWMVGQGQAVQE